MWMLVCILEMCVSFRIPTEFRQLVKTGYRSGLFPRRGKRGKLEREN